ncbi:MAG: tetratricopeptide repeat protein [Verrucomicrobiae bacterium]|nr:tetratricopeptide repeat protein [Verrucomicrobiae bacterium]NNJ41738.1 tetratricopeptide repeat protein [Akkermansiaceae bacterium]
MKTLLNVITLTLMLVVSAAADDKLLAAEHAIQGKQFDQAVELLDGHLAANKAKRGDYAVYLKALALFHSGKDKASVAACDQLAKDFAKSDWGRKALFLKCRALVRQKKFKQAEAIYEAEANRLFSADRKKGIASVLVQFGDELSRKPGKDELDAPPADFNKALQLYNKALGLEIGRDLRDAVQFKVARCYQNLSNWKQAENHYRVYLKEYDPKWSGPVGSPERFRGQVRENPRPAGQHWRDARFHLVEVQLAQCGQSVLVVPGFRHQALRVQSNPASHLGKLQMARQNAEDLLALLGDTNENDAQHSDTYWLWVRSYNLPHPARNERDKGLLVAAKFLKAHPTHPRATDTSRLIALTYQNAGETDNAIAAYQKFAAAANFTFIPEDGEVDPKIKTGKSCSATFKNWTREAVHMIGQLRFQQKKYTQAIQQWREYIARFPNGAQWAQCQSGIINAKFRIGIDAVAAKDFALAKGHFDKFLQDHPLDNRARQILFTLGQIQYALAEELEESAEVLDEESASMVKVHYRKAVEEWERLVSKYPKTEEASLALYRIGVIQEEKLGELAQALATYQRLNWGSSAGQARQRFATMTAHALSAKTERSFRTNEDVYIEVTSRNAAKLTLSQYFLNLEAYFRKTHGIGGIDELDVDLIQPDKTWDVDVENYEKYKPTTQRIKIPFEKGKPGVCVIKVSEEDFETTTLVIRTDIDIITKTSRREVLVYAQNRLTNKPASGVSVIASDGKEVFGTGKTGKDGVFCKEFFDNLKSSAGVRIFAASKHGIASNNLSLHNLKFSSGLSARGYIYTEKPTYRPGETVNVRGIIRDVKDGSYVVPKGKKYVVRILDPKGRMLKEATRKLSDFGVLDTSLTIDSHAPLGGYVISVSEKGAKAPPVFNGAFNVQRYKLEKVKLAFDFPNKVIFRGETISAKIKANYYWGSPAAGETIDYTLPDGRTYSGRTDDKGIIAIEFDPSGFLPGRSLTFGAIAKQYNVRAGDHVFLAELGFSTSVTPAQSVALAGEPIDINLKTLTADGKPVGKELTLYVLRKEISKTNKILAAVPWIKRPVQAAAEVTVEEHKVTTDAETGLVTKKLTLKKGGQYIIRVSGEDRFKQVVTTQNTVTVSDDTDAVKLRFFAESSTGQVGADLPISLHSRLDQTLALLTIEGEQILSHKVLTLKPGYNVLGLIPDHKHFPNFRIAVAAIDGRTIRSATKDLTIERELRVKVVPHKTVDAPGADALVDLLVTDQNDKPVQAALSLALVNEALYSLYPDAAPPIRHFFQSGARRNAEFRLGSTCGFAYHGRTRPVVKSVIEEKERLVRKQEEKAQLDLLRGSRYGYANQKLLGAIGAATRGLNEDNNAFASKPGSSIAQIQSEAGEADPFGESKNVTKRKSKKGKGQALEAKPRKEVMNASRWIAPIITDAEGKATVTIPLPDNTTEWRLTARGCTKDTLVGQATAQLITRKDFFLELKVPVLVQEGDAMQFLAKIHNLTDFEGKIEVSLNLEAGEGFKDSLNVEIKKHSVTECLFKSQVIPLGKSVTLTASSMAGDQSDTLVMKLPVRPWGMEFSVSAGGMTTGNAHGVLALPAAKKYTQRELELNLSPSIKQALIDFTLRSGRGASQADDLLASVAALSYATAHHATDEGIRVLRDRVQGLVASLTSTQQADGRWYWKGGTDLYLTCRSYWALALAQKAGIPLHPGILSKAEKNLVTTFSKLGTKDNDSKTIVLHALSVTGKADFAHLNRIYRERASLSNNALARAAVAMINLNRPDFARDLVNLLEKKVKLDSPDRQPKIAWWDGHGHTVLQSRDETTAMALLALAAVKPDSPLAAQAANLLLRSQGCFRYASPSSLGPAVAALAAYYGKSMDEKADFEVTVFINNKKLTVLKSGDIKQRTKVKVPSKMIKDGENIVRFEKKGPGSYHYSAVLSGFSSDLKSPDSWGHKLRFTSGHYYHGNLTYRGMPLKSASSSPVTKVELGQKIRATSEIQNYYTEGRREYRIRQEFLPAGMLVVDGSLQGNFQHHEIGDGVITMFYSPGKDVGGISYELVAYAPGTYRILPGTVRDLYNRNRMAIGKARTLTVLPPGENSEDPYKMNRYEHNELATLNFNDGNYEPALKHLLYLFKNHRKHYEREAARMLLWIYTMDKYFNAERVVEMFEILRERHPDLTIPFKKILAVGKAYRVIGEHERAWLVYRATVDSSFINDASLSATLEDQGQFLGSLEYMDRIWREYPDTSEVVTAYFAISQQLYEKAPKAHELKAEEDRRRRQRGAKAAEEAGYDRIGLLKRSLEYLHGFLSLYPDEPLADDAAFSMANAFFALKDYKTVVAVAERFQKRYPKSSFVSSFQYMAALGHFWQLHYVKALASAAPVSDGDSKDRDYARYITAQIHHAQGAPGKAIDWYRKVEKLYPDAKESIGYFEEEKISLEEVTTFKPGEKVELDLKFRNIKEAYLQVYKVDLMKLYLREKNLSNITKVHLAGIEPESELTLQLGKGKDYRDREQKAVLPLKDEGAYLVICRGDNLFTSGMVLVTPLKLEIQESPSAGSLRVNVRDTINEGYQADVHVKAIGSSDNEFKSGDTDLRGIFVAEGLNGSATVIARQEGRYAFYRGSNHLGRPVAPNAVPKQQRKQAQKLQQKDFLQNLNDSNSDIQHSNIEGWNSFRRQKGGKGVEVQKAY